MQSASAKVHRAFCLPGVLVTVGAARWPELRHLFQSLARNPERSVRVPISCALHEVRGPCVHP